MTRSSSEAYRKAATHSSSSNEPSSAAVDIQALKPPVDSIFIIPQNSKKAIQKHVLNDMEVPDMIGGSRLQVIPRYLPGAKCDELLQHILACNNLRQYHMGHKVEPRLHLLLHEDASPMDSPTGVGYVYHGVRMKAQPFSTIEGIEQIAKQLATEFGVLKWTIGIEVIVYASGEDSKTHAPTYIYFPLFLELSHSISYLFSPSPFRATNVVPPIVCIVCIALLCIIVFIVCIVLLCIIIFWRKTQ